MKKNRSNQIGNSSSNASKSRRNRDKQSAKMILEQLNEEDPVFPGEKKTTQERAAEVKRLARQKLEEQTIDENQMEMEVDDEEAISHKERVAPLELDLPPGKKFFRIGEAADYIQVEPYVLRYWESEFTVIRPNKTRSGHRIYTRRDVKNFKNIRNLLYSEGFSVKQAKKELATLKKQEKMAANATSAVEIHYRTKLKGLASELRQLIQTIKQTPWSV